MADEVRFYLDEHIPNAVAQGLRRRRIDVLTTFEARRGGSPDKDQMRFAARQGWIIVTGDADYLAAAALGESHAGIVFLTEHAHSVGRIVSHLTLIHDQLTAVDMTNRVEFL
ncbi:MAG: DUF5615 family PIN-like protein [Candidatus Hydrogenedentes bacterium]|nr:DUF5615 family PIN-like protein [Candidatus Hydrogenedentota bacterium]